MCHFEGNYSTINVPRFRVTNHYGRLTSRRYCLVHCQSQHRQFCLGCFITLPCDVVQLLYAGLAFKTFEDCNFTTTIVHDLSVIRLNSFDFFADKCCSKDHFFCRFWRIARNCCRDVAADFGLKSYNAFNRKLGVACCSSGGTDWL